MAPKECFDKVSVLATGIQPGRERFARRRGRDDDTNYADHHDFVDDEPHLISSWRCNLTALSEFHNLYFVAYEEKIHVYQPQFPTQALARSPALIIDSPPSATDLAGHIDFQHPHAINNLAVQLLGKDEVVAVVRDDGDVDAYFTRHIHRAIERRGQAGNTLGLHGVDIKAFFHRNVGKSAWGLAIHTEARMIAVSSNNLEVTIFTFALTEQETIDPECEDPEEEQIYHSSSGIVPPADRKSNDTRVIANGKANIPHIAFCNTGHDPTGRWLISTDIAGVVRSWDVHTLSPGGALLATVNSTSTLFGATSFDRDNAGWSLMFLDPQSFRHTRKGISEALGLPSASDHPHPGSRIWDTSSSLFEVNNRSDYLEDCQPGDVVDGDYLNDAYLSQRSATNNTEHSEEESMSSEARLYNLYRGRQAHQLRQSHQLRFQGTSSLCADLPNPIMHGSVTTLYLFQPPDGPAAYGHAPVITLSEPFAQSLPDRYYPLQMFDRCNMCTQIAPLGVVIVATQKGNVGVLSLTQLVTKTLSHQAGGEKDDFIHKRVYGFRVDHILPFASQEKMGHRPPAPLHGIAVGPMQGSENARDAVKRWRLLVMYQDHSVLSYEIARSETDGDDDGVDGAGATSVVVV